MEATRVRDYGEIEKRKKKANQIIHSNLYVGTQLTTTLSPVKYEWKKKIRPNKAKLYRKLR